jgi:regulator of nucleoside diphosphate kinase
MTDRTIHITEFDNQRLRELLAEARFTGYSGKEYLLGLEKELDRAQVVDPKTVPPDLVTMNSKVRLEDLETGEEMVYTLVFPEYANLAENKISILAPIGTAILGYRVGDTFEWKVPGGISRIKIKELLYQPEAAGDYDL